MQDRDYLLASITEFGAATADYGEILRDLRIRERQRQSKGFPCAHRFAAMLGSTDLIEISRFDHYFHLSAVGGSSAQAFRRSIGVRCPMAGQLPENRFEGICTINEALENCPELPPLFAVMYLKLSPIPALCLALEPERQALAKSLFEHVCTDEKLWDDYRAVERSSRRLSECPEAEAEMMVAPLLGLDSVELALVVRACSFEQLAALAFALRHQPLRRFASAAEHPAAVGRAGRLLVPWPDVEAETASAFDADVDWDVDWDESPLFSNTATVVGMLLNQTGEDWQVDGYEKDPVVASEATVFKQSRLIAGSSPPPLRRENTGDASPAEPSGPRGAEGGGQKLDFLMLFDRMDVLEFSSDGYRRRPDGSGGTPVSAPLRSVNLSEIRGHLGFLIERDDTGKLKGHDQGIRTALRIAVRTIVPREVEERMPTNRLLMAFHGRLRKLREKHLSRDRSHAGWTSRWLDGTKRAGTIYPVTNSGVNLIASVLDYLEDDIDGFIDLLPVLDRLVRMANRTYHRDVGEPEESFEHHFQLDLIEFYKNAEILAASRGRRDHPLRLPQGTLSFEGHAGYRSSRDAFFVFLESLSDEGGHEGLILLQDSSGDGISCRPGRRHSNAVRASAMILHHPFYWGIFAHELAHGSFQHARIRTEGSGASEEQRRLESDCRRLKEKIHPDLEVEPVDTLESVFHELRSSMRWMHLSWPLSQVVSRIFDEVLADLLLWDALKDGFSSARDRREFWFLAGPTALFDLQHKYGAHGPGHESIQCLILRWFFVHKLLKQDLEVDKPSGDAEWEEEFRGLLEDLWEFEIPDRQDLDPKGQRNARNGAALIRFLCLKEDLSIDDARWTNAIYELQQEMTRDVGELRHVSGLLQAWMPVTRSFRALIEKKRRPGPSGRESPRQMYSKYLATLAEQWQHARPWLPLVPSHGLPGDPAQASPFRWRLVESPPKVAVSRRGGILSVGADQELYNQLTLDLIAKLNDHARARRADKLASYLTEPQLSPS